MDYEIARSRMVKEQLISQGITDERVLWAMGSVPRHLFVDQAFWPRAYSNHPLPIGNDQTISQPYIVALMTQELNLPESGETKVLEIGTGSGYQAAILSMLGCNVYSIERHDDLSKRASKTLTKLGMANVTLKVGDGSLGWEDKSPFQDIIVTAGAPAVPEALLNQLAVNGKIVIPVGDRSIQKLITITRGEKMVERKEICGCNFVPLVGRQAWDNG